MMKQADIKCCLNRWRAADAIVIEARKKSIVETALHIFGDGDFAQLNAAAFRLNTELRWDAEIGDKRLFFSRSIKRHGDARVCERVQRMNKIFSGSTAP